MENNQTKEKFLTEIERLKKELKKKKKYGLVWEDKPEDVVEIKPDYVDALIAEDVVASKTELRRLLEAGGVRNAETGEKLSEIPKTVDKPLVLKIGKRRFVKLV